jgi:hypothetical protein
MPTSESLGDRYTFMGETKDSGLPIEPGRRAIALTSNLSISQAFSREKDQKAIRRRFGDLQMGYINRVNQNFICIGSTKLAT